MAGNARGTKVESSRMDPINLDQAHMLIRIPLADLGPGQGLGDRRGNRFDSDHGSILGHTMTMSSFVRSRPAAASSFNRAVRLHRQLPISLVGASSHVPCERPVSVEELPAA